METFMTIEDCIQKTHAVWLFITESQIRYWTEKEYIGHIEYPDKDKNIKEYKISIDKFVSYIKDKYEVEI